MRECRFCGQLFQEENGHQVFCSEHCRREQQNLLRRIKRKEKISTRDWRPRRSHLEWTDFKRTEEGYFIAGENYPSVDHVQPLSKNGTHTWDNVRLAHKHCNTVKNNNLLGEKENGQIILFC